jgi:hypothetical protein
MKSPVVTSLAPQCPSKHAALCGESALPLGPHSPPLTIDYESLTPPPCPQAPLFRPSTTPPRPTPAPPKPTSSRGAKPCFNQGVFLLYKDPFMPVEGKMQYLFDETGRRYLDCFGGICTVSVGHCSSRGECRAHRPGKTASSSTPHLLLAPHRRRVCRETRRHVPGAAHPRLFRQLRLRSQRPRRAHGAPLHLATTTSSPSATATTAATPSACR